jgi:hypothetical protein
VQGVTLYQDRMFFGLDAFEAASRAYHQIQNLVLTYQTGGFLRVRLVPSTNGYEVVVTHDDRCLACMRLSQAVADVENRKTPLPANAVEPAGGWLFALYAPTPITPEDVAPRGELIPKSPDVCSRIIRNWRSTWSRVAKKASASNGRVHCG